MWRLNRSRINGSVFWCRTGSVSSEMSRRRRRRRRLSDVTPLPLCFSRTTWSCWRRAALRPPGRFCPWRGRRPWPRPPRRRAGLQPSSTRTRRWRSSSGTSTRTCPTPPRRRSSFDRFFSPPRLQVSRLLRSNRVTSVSAGQTGQRSWRPSGPAPSQQETPALALLRRPHQGTPPGFRPAPEPQTFPL